MIKRLHLTWLVLAAGAITAALTLQEYSTQWVGTGSFLGHYSSKLAIMMGVVAISGLLALAGLALSLTPAWARLTAGYERAAARLGRLGGLLPVLMVLVLLALPVLLLVSPLNTFFFNGTNARLWITLVLSLVVMFLGRAWRPAWDAFGVLCAGLLVCGMTLLLLNFRNDLSASIFTLDWSEGSRYYNASTWFSRQVYGFSLPLPELHPTRYLLQGLAFLVPGATIAFHRAWQVFLWIACNGLTAWALVRRLKPQSATLRTSLLLVLFGLWSFLTFFEGPVYYHLILCAALVLLWFDRAHFWRSLAVVAVASIWAGISRINWYPVPGLMAVVLYLMEEPVLQAPEGELRQRSLWRYLLPPLIWAGVGLGLAFLANAIYIPLSGNPAEVFGSALKSPLLWYRLKPNPTFGPGVLLASVVFLPVGLIAAWPVLRALRKWHWVRLLGLLAVLGVFYGGGILVSLKVGGGSNLHNMDNFIVFLVVIVGYIFFGKFNPDGEVAPWHAPAWAVLLVLAVPLYAAASGLNLAPRSQPQMSETQALQWLQGMIDKYATDGRPVLFITDRQLVTFHQIKVPSFEPSYEKVFLQEMAMSNNPYYLKKYVADLKARKFSLIITEPMNAQIQADYGFAEENNLFVTNVEIPTLGRYDLVGKLDQAGYPIAVYAPRPPAQ